MCLCVCVCMSRCEEALKMFGQKKDVTALHEILEIWAVFVYIHVCSICICVCIHLYLYICIYLHACYMTHMIHLCVCAVGGKGKARPRALAAVGGCWACCGRSQARLRCVRSDSFICATWLIHMGGMTHSYVWHDSFAWVTWLVRTWISRVVCGRSQARLRCVWRDSFACVTWIIHMCGILIRKCGMTHSRVWHYSFTRICCKYCKRSQARFRCVWHEAFMCVTWLTHMCDMTHPRGLAERAVDDDNRAASVYDVYKWVTCVLLGHIAFIHVTWLVYMCDVTHSHVWHDIFTCVAWLIHMGLTWLICIRNACDVTCSHVRHDFSHVWHDLFTCVSITHSYQSCTWRDLFTCVTWLYTCVTWCIQMDCMTNR